MKLTIEFAQQLAIEREGKCLSTAYINCELNLIWECSEGHVWPATLNNVKNKESWCPTCAPNAKWTVEELNQIAIENGGRLISTVHINSVTHLQWECEFKHTWWAIPNSIVQGSWCPDCRQSRGEREIRKWLISNNTDFTPQMGFEGYRYSYDFYIPSTNWLIEFDGGQHFEHNSHFHSKYTLEDR